MSKEIKNRQGSEPKPATDPMRTAVRFPLRLELTLETENGEQKAVTEDISASGVLFTMESLPAIGSRIEFTMMMPAEAMGNASDVNVHCVGRIVRHERSDTVQRAAAVIDEYTLKA